MSRRLASPPRLALASLASTEARSAAGSKDAGATVGATIVAALTADAIARAFCTATGATGVAIQPIRSHEKTHQPCRRGHYFVLIADRDHVLFEYTHKETAAFAGEMLHGFGGYVQADARSVYEALFRDPIPTTIPRAPSRARWRAGACHDAPHGPGYSPHWHAEETAGRRFPEGQLGHAFNDDSLSSFGGFVGLVLDENRDGEVDFREMVTGMSPIPVLLDLRPFQVNALPDGA